jgi:glycosyltransferase involved in cell wall biosynthesis
MKIAYLSSAEMPSNTAHSLQVMKMCQAMEQEGHAVTLILPSAGRQSPVDELNRMYGVKIGFEIRRVEQAPVLGRRGLALTLAREAARLSPDMAYTRGIDIGWAAAARGLRTVVEVHSPPAGWFGPIYFRMLLRNKAVRILVISRPLEETLRKGYPELANYPILVAPDAVDLERYKYLPPPEKARARLGLPPKEFTAGYSGGLVAGRGVEQILELAERMPEVSFLILGGDEPILGRWKRRTPGRANIRWKGHVPNAELPLYQAACDVLLMPYQRQVTVQGRGNSAEIMSPLKLYEYMAAGRLILASDLSALRVILNETNSVLLPCDAIEPWVQALQKAKRAKVWAGRLAVRARRDVQPFTWRNRVKAIMEFAGGGRMSFPRSDRDAG